MKIFLIGYRCTGKTTIGKRLADQLHLNYMDLDLVIEQDTGSSILKIVEEQGWVKFRQLEKDTLFGTKNLEDIVVSTGGGIIMDPENQKFIKDSGFSIWLDADIKTIVLRLKTDPKTASSRPKLTHENILKETEKLLKLRAPLYEDASHIRIDTNLDTPEEIVNIIHRRLS